MMVKDSQQKILDPGFVLFSTRQQGVLVILKLFKQKLLKSTFEKAAEIANQNYILIVTQINYTNQLDQFQD
ncbi:unnamed protein product [Schistosoma mattheei]|uniref:Uncharacterized protein n=1 Tax=Schistosoma mattheei TaxID=31246 RepID=A0A183NRM2_9TREM|nr:unnamed protein product [Schistosoma mattheei]